MPNLAASLARIIETMDRHDLKLERLRIAARQSDKDMTAEIAATNKLRRDAYLRIEALQRKLSVGARSYSPPLNNP